MSVSAIKDSQAHTDHVDDEEEEEEGDLASMVIMPPVSHVCPPNADMNTHASCIHAGFRV